VWPGNGRPLRKILLSYFPKTIRCLMTSWKKVLALAMGLPSTILGIFFLFQELVKAGVVSQGFAQGLLIAVVVSILIRMILISWKKK
jgi:hypothetical protein